MVTLVLCVALSGQGLMSLDILLRQGLQALEASGVLNAIGLVLQWLLLMSAALLLRSSWIEERCKGERHWDSIC